MSPKLPTYTSGELIRILERDGFRQVGQEGSHVKMRNSTSITIIVPVHRGKDLKPGLVLAVLKRAGIDPMSLRED